MHHRRRAIALCCLGAAALLGGCAALNTIEPDVTSYGQWPAGRAPGLFAFDRLPSQQADAQAQAAVEAAARPALEALGFRLAPAGTPPEVLVQVGARATRVEMSPWIDPLWWRGGFGHWRSGPWSGPRVMWVGWDERPRVEHEVAVLLRDRASGQPLIEARASSASSTARSADGLRALFVAALTGFPATSPKTRSVSVPLSPGAASAAR